MFEATLIRWVVGDDASVAYQRFGDGPVDLVLVHGVVSHIEAYFELPGFGSFVEHLGRTARVIHIDKRGAGLSDRFDGYPPLEVRVRDIEMVLHQENVDRAWLMGDSEGSTICALAAAMFPERVNGLILFGG